MGGDNPLDGFTFIYKFENRDLDASPASVTRVVIPGYGPASVDATALPLRDIRPTFAYRTTTGDSIGFNFPPSPGGFGAIDGGESSSFLVLRTNSRTINETEMLVYSNETLLGTVRTFAPVPEPTTRAAGTFAAAVILLTRRRRALTRFKRRGTQ